MILKWQQHRISKSLTKLEQVISQRLVEKLLTISKNWRPSLAAWISADLTKFIKPGRQPWLTSETKWSSIMFGSLEPSAGETQRLPRVYATSFLMSNGAVDSKCINKGMASLEKINFLWSMDPAAILDRTHAASYRNSLKI